MNAFISEGQIRLMDGTGITIGELEPTAKQYTLLERFIERTLDSDDYFAVDIINQNGNNIENREYSGMNKYARTRDIADWAKRNGYDSVVFKNLYDDGGNSHEPVPMADVYVIFDPAAVKSLDPVTYDDEGNIIPPSQRANENTNDFRYSTARGYSAEDIWKHKDLQYASLKKAGKTGNFTSPNSIQTFGEMLADTNEFPYGFTKDDAWNAEESGKLKVYSYEPIENGAPVYTLKGDAKAYSKNGEVYEKVVSLYDVAWDSIEGGLYAQVDSAVDNFTLESLLNISYNEYTKERDKWEADGKVEKGTRRIMYNPYNGNFEYWKKGDDALLKLVESTSFKEVEEKYERDDSQREQELFGTFGWTWNSKGQAPSDTALYAGQGNNGSSDSGAEKAERTANSEGSGRPDNGYNNETARDRITDERLTEGGALSNAQKAYQTARGIEDDYLENASEEELADIEAEVDRRMMRDYWENFATKEERAEMNELLDAMKEVERTGLLDKPIEYEGRTVERKALRSDVDKVARKIRNELKLNHNGVKYVFIESEIKMIECFSTVSDLLLIVKSWKSMVFKVNDIIINPGTEFFYFTETLFEKNDMEKPRQCADIADIKDKYGIKQKCYRTITTKDKDAVVISRDNYEASVNVSEKNCLSKTIL